MFSGILSSDADRIYRPNRPLVMRDFSYHPKGSRGYKDPCMISRFYGELILEATWIQISSTRYTLKGIDWKEPCATLLESKRGVPSLKSIVSSAIESFDMNMLLEVFLALMEPEGAHFMFDRQTISASQISFRITMNWMKASSMDVKVHPRDLFERKNRLLFYWSGDGLTERHRLSFYELD